MNSYEESMQDICPHCGYNRIEKVAESYHLPPETILQGRYIVGKVLGFGGFGITYIGFDAELERVVAIKEYLPSAFATRLPGDTHVSVYQGDATTQYGAGLQRFVEEARALAQFNGVKGVVDIYDSFMSNNSAYIIMQFIKGKDVKKILREEGTLSYERAREIVLAICDTLAPIHAKGMIHRDISPDNIYITDDGEIKLLDFGAARYESSVNSKSLSVILKSGYAPEEQYRSKGEQGSWTDVYALAATFYKMIVGRTPQDSMERAITDELQEPSKLGVELPISSENAILNALGVRKQDRTQTVTEFKEALLSDGVERIVVKPVKMEKAGIPMGAKVAMILGAVIFLGLGIFTVTGGFDNAQVIGGTILEDSFGSVDSSGYATVPNLVGLTYDEAIETLEASGLDWEVESYEFGSIDGEAYVSEQSDAAGSQVLLGKTISYTVNVGSPMQGIEMGWIPNLMEMEYYDALVLLSESSWTDGYYVERYVYSSEEEKGYIVDITYEDIYPEDDSEDMLYVVSIGIGEEGTNTTNGNLELGYVTYRGSSIEFVVSDVEMSDENYGIASYVNIYVSLDDGTTWELLEERKTVSLYYDELVSASIRIGSINIFECANIYNESYMDIPLVFKVERVSEMDQQVIDTIELEGTLAYTIEATSEVMIEELSSDEAYDAYLAGDISSNQEYYFENEYYLNEGTSYWKLTGDFQKGEYYSLIQTSPSGSDNGCYEYIECVNQGELYFAWMADVYGNANVELMLRDSSYSYDSNSGIRVEEPWQITLPESQYLDMDIYTEEPIEVYEEPADVSEEINSALYEEKLYELLELYGEDFILELQEVANEFETEEEFWEWLMENY